MFFPEIVFFEEWTIVGEENGIGEVGSDGRPVCAGDLKELGLPSFPVKLISMGFEKVLRVFVFTRNKEKR